MEKPKKKIAPPAPSLLFLLGKEPEPYKIKWEP
jgi:hypothetical protein